MKLNASSFTLLFMLLFIVTIPGSAAVFQVPEVQKDNNGYEVYKEPLTINSSNAGTITIDSFNSPEAPVIFFYISKIRNDSTFKNTLAPAASYTKREKKKLQLKLSKMKNWKFLEFKLVKRYKKNESSYWIKIYMNISINGREDGGTDDVEVIRINGRWYLKMPPT